MLHPTFSLPSCKESLQGLNSKAGPAERQGVMERDLDKEKPGGSLPKSLSTLVCWAGNLNGPCVPSG